MEEPREPGTRVICHGNMTHPETLWGADTWTAEEYAFCCALRPADSQREEYAQLRHCMVHNVPLPLGHVRPVGQWWAPYASPMDLHHWGQDRRPGSVGRHPQAHVLGSRVGPGVLRVLPSQWRDAPDGRPRAQGQDLGDCCQHCGEIDNQAVLCENCSHVCCTGWRLAPV